MKYTLIIGFCPESHYLPLAKAADAAGWDAICVPDGLFWYEHTSTPYPYSKDGNRFWAPDTPFMDPFVIMPMMAAVTERIHFYTNVLKLPVRDPLLVAKALGSMEAMAPGRFGLGVGLSPWPEDFEVLGQAWGNRGPRSAEMVEVIRGVLEGGMWEHHGKYYDYPPMQIAPVPKAPVPVYFGGLVDAVYRRAARIGDGYIGWESPKCSREQLTNIVNDIKGYLVEEGRDPSAFEFKAQPAGTSLDCVDAMRDIGITDYVCMPWMYYRGDFFDLQHRIDSVQRFADEVISKESR